MFTECHKEEIDLLIIAGEASGDEHASILVEKILIQHPELRVAAIGGKNLKASGAQFLFDLVDHAVVGVFEVLKNYGFFKKLFAHSVGWIRKFEPKAVLLVDYPGFNLRLAEALKNKQLSLKGGGQIKVLQYISPQLWAWKSKRRFKMAKVLDGLAVIFPFEVDCYKDVDLSVSFVGHPYVSSNYSPSVKFDENGPLLLLPGSRVQPVQRILPVFLDASKKLLQEFPDLKIELPVPNKKIKQVVEVILSEHTELKNQLKIRDGLKDLRARATLMSSGTISLACALSGIPGVISYRAHPLTYILGRILIKVPFLGMANLLLKDEPPYLELIQDKATGETLFLALQEILEDEASVVLYSEVAGKLKQNLKKPQDSGVIDWLAEELNLG